MLLAVICGLPMRRAFALPLSPSHNTSLRICPIRSMMEASDESKEEPMKPVLFLCYPRCSTCQKAKKWLDANGIAYEERHIKDDRPDAAELKAWQEQSGLPLRKFFNTSGLQYKALQLKDRLPAMSEAEQLALLASDGMLVKRPILVGDGFVLVGFKEDAWRSLSL